MATLLGLSNELIILIASNLTRPVDLLQFALTNQRIYDIAIKTLYENVTIDPSDYPPFATSWYYPNDNFIGMMSARSLHGPPYSNLMRLSGMIRSNALPSGRTITRLSLSLGLKSTANRFQTLCSTLLPQLSSLKDLTLVSVKDYYQGWDSEPFSLATLGAAFDSLSQTLETLDMNLYLDPRQNDGWTVGSFRNFSKLKFLSVQGCVLLGRCGSPIASIPSLDSVLPPSLKCLRLQWCSMHELQSLAIILETFVEDSVMDSRRMERLAVRLNNVDGSPRERPPVKALDRSIEAINEKARAGGLQLELALEWSNDYQGGRRLGDFVEIWPQMWVRSPVVSSLLRDLPG